MSLELVRELWDYHAWANRRLFAVTVALGEETAGREMGRHFSVPTLRGMFVHIYGADHWWLQHWKGGAPVSSGGADMFYGYVPQALAELRPRWDELESEQRRFIGTLGEADLARIIEGTGRLGTFRLPLGTLLLHLPNHATHHRSEIATMLTTVGAAPPDTGLVSYYAAKTGPRRS
jgi:uncharacterized damage-inducible protein DinB